MGFDEWSNGKKVAVVLIVVIAIVCVVGAVTTVFIAGEIGKTAEVVSNISQNTNNGDNNIDADDNSSITGQNTSDSVINVVSGEYSIQIETENDWAYYITTDGQYSQKEGSGSETIDLGMLNDYSSITIDQKGSGNTKVSVFDSNNKLIAEKTNSIDYGSIYLLLKVKKS